ncbi:hypothetical protein D9M71_473210 [compost metagenome]
MVAHAPAGLGQYLQHPQNRVGYRHPFENVHPTGQQLVGGVDFAVFVQHFTEQRGGEPAGIGAALVAPFGLIHHFAINALGLADLTFHGQAQADQATAQQGAARGAQ